MKKHRLGSLFAGIGGIDLGFSEAGVEPTWANEIDVACAKTFVANHKKTKLIVDDINNIHASDIPEIDFLCGGFPCQPFSVAGHRRGFDDDRGNLFFQIIRIIEELSEQGRQPEVVFLENVKNLFNHDNGKTYALMKENLLKNGYYVVEKILFIIINIS